MNFYGIVAVAVTIVINKRDSYLLGLSYIGATALFTSPTIVALTAFCTKIPVTKKYIVIDFVCSFSLHVALNVC